MKFTRAPKSRLAVNSRIQRLCRLISDRIRISQRSRFALVVATLIFGALRCAVADPASELFESKVRPVLIEACFKCHGGEKTSGGLRVDSREALLKGGDQGAAIVPGKPSESLLLKALSHQDNDFKMPPDKKLPDDHIAAIEAWIAAGATWPAHSTGFQAKRHWAFQPIVRVTPPQLASTSVRNEVDAFVIQKLQTAGLKFSPEADRRTLLRRATVDLHGLPPTQEQLAEFEADESPLAFERLVDRLLSAPQYGERWGRYWLDVARYADTKGYVFMEDRNYPFAYRYRDWVVQALNDDLPYDQFLIRQIAADLLPEPTRTANLPALGFLTLGRRFLNNIHDIIDDRIDVVCRGTMALTVGCARCHDHKFDPIPATDYYSLYGVFRSSHEPKPDEAKPLMAMTLIEDEKPFEPYVFLRGQQQNHGPQVPRQFLSVVAGPQRKPFEQRSGRLEMAQAIASPQNPLTARVMVNRVWMLHFGQPLVSSPSDFGLRCDPPTHPELLDWLASEFIAHGWSLKWLHRTLMTSATWRQQSGEALPAAESTTAAASDPENRWLSRMNRRRLDWEALRDSLLATSGRLDRSLGGPATDLLKPPFVSRRTVYGFIDRQNLPLLFRTFDFASPDTHAPARFVTSIPQQPLFLRNSPFVTELSRALAAQAAAADQPVHELFSLTLGRDAAPDELAILKQFLDAAALDTPSAPVWQYGYGEYLDDTKLLKSFTSLPHWTGKQWQGGPQLPDARLGWVLWHAAGGHPGDATHAAVLRWTAPRDATVVITGTLKHNQAEGDGVLGIVWSSRTGERARFVAHHQSTEAFVPAIEVKQGETVNFVVSSRSSPTHDSFQWAPQIVATANANRQTWSAATDFPKTPSGTTGDTPMTPLEQLAQVLLLSNEFQFVD